MQCSLEASLEKNFGFSGFREGQKEVIEKIMCGRSVAAIFPTGAGKSLCYQLPSLLLPGLTLVVSPLLSLMHDQLDFLQKHDIRAASLDSTLSREEYHSTLQLAIAGELSVLMISVERFRNERFRGSLAQMNISLLVVDEAHCISEWGHNFRPEYLKLPHYVQEFSIPQVLLLTATATINVANDMCQKLSIAVDDCVRTGFYRDNLFLQVTPVTSQEKNSLLLKRLQERGRGATIVYVTLQKSAEELAFHLSEKGYKAKAYHAGMRSDDRTIVQSNFMSGQLDIVVATIAFGMGIDKSNIRQIFHYDLPKSIENYSQEIGRAGRDGKPSYCEVFANRDGVRVLENFVYGDTPTKESILLLLQQIRSAERVWEVKLTSLSNETNIRPLPLKTLLVYLEMKGTISSMYSYFADYQFKTGVSGAEIINKFTGERRDFLYRLFQFTEKKKVWITVKLEDFLQQTGTERARAVAALEYLDSQNLIELSTKQAIDLYRIENSHFHPEELAEELYGLFLDKESSEVERIGAMIRFFESESCLSTNLASYYGESKEGYRCGHCSVCQGAVATMIDSLQLPPLSDISVEELTVSFKKVAGEYATVDLITRFLCGIALPLFTRLKAKKLPGFAALENYSYAAVRERVKTLFT